MFNFWRDLRHGFRLLVAHPGFSGISIAVLALGIGAAATMFTVVNAVLLRPLPYATPERLAWVAMHFPEFGGDLLPAADYIEWRDQNHVFESLAGFTASERCDLTGQDEPISISCGSVTANLLPTLGVQPALGRAFLPAESKLGAPGAAILSHGFWQRRFGGDHAVIGRAITLDNAPYTVIGVLPAAFLPPQNVPVDVFVPLQMNEAEQLQRNRMLMMNAIGRLRPGIPFAEASAGLGPLFEHSKQAWSKGGAAAKMQLNITPFGSYSVRDVRLGLLVLLGAVTCVLLIACANVANLALGRAVSRQREFAIRTALGASAGRLARQLLVESVLLSGIGATAGLAVASVSYRWLLRLVPDSVPRMNQVGIDWHVVVFTVLLSAATAVLFGVAPALMASRSEMKPATRGRSYLRNALVVAELALSLVLLIGAGLLLQSLYRLTNVPTGLRSDHVLTTALSLTGPAYREKQAVLAFGNELIERARGIPGVTHVAISDALPPTESSMVVLIHIAGRPQSRPDPQRDSAIVRGVSSAYFRALGIPLRQGRLLESADKDAVMVNEAFVRRHFPGSSPLGRQVRAFNSSLTIVGVVGDAKNEGLRENVEPEIFQLFGQGRALHRLELIVRTSAEPLASASAVRTVVWEMNKDLPLTFETLDGKIAQLRAGPRFQTILLGLFAALALLLAMVGIYGVIAYLVGQRTREIGIRKALGADRTDIVRWVLRHSFVLIGIGVALGLALAMTLTRFLSTLLFGVSPIDTGTFVAVAALMTATALAASLVPAIRAARVDPSVALRSE